MVRLHHKLNGPEFEQTPGDSRVQRTLSMGLQRVGHNLVTEQQQCINIFVSPPIHGMWYYRNTHDNTLGTI